MQILKSEIKEKIYNVFGLLDAESIEESKKYNFKIFSAFECKLTEQEQTEQIWHYQEALDSGDGAKVKQYFKHHDKFLAFYLNLYKNYKVYGVLAQEYSGCRTLVEFDSIKEYKSHILLSIREQLFLKIVIPELYSIIEGNYDLTHLIYILKNKKAAFKKLSSLIIDAGLFIWS